MTTFHDRADSLDGVDQRKVLGNENQLYLVRIDRITLATRMVKCHVVQQQDGARRQRKVFNDSTKRMLIYKPPLRSKLRSPSIFELHVHNFPFEFFKINAFLDDPG
jgi:hypothetical protein